MSAPKVELLPDVFVQRLGGGVWLLYNVFIRTSVGVDAAAFALIEDICADRDVAADAIFKVWDTERFSNLEGLYADPTRIKRDGVSLGEPETLGPDAFVERLIGKFILCADRPAYLARFGAKTSAFDFERFGNFHQQLGQHLVLGKRRDHDEWWLEQKFRDDGSAVREGPYRNVQEAFLNDFIPEAFTPSMWVLDLGCGPGYFTERIAATGADVVGVDPSDRFIEMARDRDGAKARYETAEVGVAGGLDGFESAIFDAVFMSDALLFYFVPPSPDIKADLETLLADVVRLLKDGGRFISLDPHPQFWLAPWLGEAGRPYTVATEYATRRFHVTGKTPELVNALGRHGLAVVRMEDLFDRTGGNTRAAGFAREFPLWRLVEAVKLVR